MNKYPAWKKNANICTINKTYERKMETCHIKEIEPQQPIATNNNTTSNMQKKQVGITSLALHQDEDIDIQVMAITPKYNGYFATIIRFSRVYG